jgi:hypothetical protein
MAEAKAMSRRRGRPAPRIPGRTTVGERLAVFAVALGVLALVVGGAFGVGYLIGKILL